MPKHGMRDMTAPRPTYGQRARKVVARSLFLSLAPFLVNLFFQGKREFEKEIKLAKKVRSIKKKG